jgi:hypothetical protein
MFVNVWISNKCSHYLECDDWVYFQMSVDFFIFYFLFFLLNARTGYHAESHDGGLSSVEKIKPDKIKLILTK